MSPLVSIALVGCLAAGVWIGYQLVLQNGRILLQLKGIAEQLEVLNAKQAAVPQAQPRTPAALPVGSRAPGFELPDLAGKPHRLSDWTGRKVLLMFFNPGCGFCREMASQLEDVEFEDTVLPVVVSTGPAEDSRKLAQEHNLKLRWLFQTGSEVSSSYSISGTPTGYLIDEGGSIASPLKVGAAELLAQLQQKRAPTGAGKLAHARTDLSTSKIKRDGLSPGTQAPEFLLPRVGGGELALSAFRGRQVLLVFSDPHCGPCQELCARLAKDQASQGGPQILMISRGTPEENSAKVAQYGLQFPVALQLQWEISRLYAFFATPVAYLIDEEGRIAANVAVGVDRIMALWVKASRGTNAEVLDAS